MNGMFTAPSVLRLRRLLHQRGFRLRPWCSQEEILDAFYTQLADTARGDDFWRELGTLATELALDLEQPMRDNPYGVNVATNTAQLLHDIRAALAVARTAPLGYHALNRILPSNAMVLLLAVSMAAVGCGGEVADGHSSGDNNGGNGGGTVGSGQGGTSGAGATSGINMNGGKGGANELTFSWNTANPTGGSGAGGTAVTSYADAPCSDPPDPPPTVEQIMDACGIDPGVKQQYLEALNASEASWPAGFAAYFDCATCGNLVQFIGYCSRVGINYVTTPFDDPSRMCEPILIYLGVRFA